ncbi:hypothetical protein cd3_027 [Carnobacterium phage cd3]|uniref:Uncharacterized protein n=2 Tax=Carnodivirus TaxID=3044682 RepID=A0AAE7SSM0_9CAUD|nr:hypothetical protein PQD68_gp027 [Carnobacterium phage cd2]YP_010676493.1 hypothetical protein PQD69_gp027 [Carnobacterium phage cd4]QXP45153.1 hypothetical protein cd2_027 [Carnobacterium phage cd2]QXP45291.1 hypothetical protein cd3_027 [Carnobacterium phage cd3]QXP45374.1 hypothetical protein cd4_027 [Carnobacterium phage cd4]
MIQTYTPPLKTISHLLKLVNKKKTTTIALTKFG